MKKLDGKRMCRYLLMACILTGAFLGIFLGKPTASNVADAVSLTGILFLILALFRTAKYLHFYDLPIYGGKKFAELFRKYEKEESTLGEYHEYVQSLNYRINFIEAYVTAGILLFSSFLASAAG